MISKHHFDIYSDGPVYCQNARPFSHFNYGDML